MLYKLLIYLKEVWFASCFIVAMFRTDFLGGITTLRFHYHKAPFELHPQRET